MKKLAPLAALMVSLSACSWPDVYVDRYPQLDHVESLNQLCFGVGVPVVLGIATVVGLAWMTNSRE